MFVRSLPKSQPSCLSASRFAEQTLQIHGFASVFYLPQILLIEVVDSDTTQKPPLIVPAAARLTDL
ncbi:unnamed protein product, partial [Citrullus colocynthis]